MLRSKRHYLGKLCVISCILIFAAACGSSDNNSDSKAGESATANEAQKAAAPTPEPTPTPEQTVFYGPHGVTVDLNDSTLTELLYECLQGHEYFVTEILTLVTDQAILAYSDTEFGNIWGDFGDMLVEEFNVLRGLMDCEDEFPRVFDGFYQDSLFDVIDYCREVSNYSSAVTDDLCDRSLSSFTTITDSMVSRLNRIDDFFGELTRNGNTFRD